MDSSQIMQFYTINGVTLEIPGSFRLGLAVKNALESGRYERPELKALLMVVKPADIILEIGGGLGLIACSAAKIVGSDSVTTVEANPDLIPILKRNLEVNNVAGVQVIFGAATIESDLKTADYFIGPNFTAASLRDGGRNGAKKIQVPLVNFTSLLEQYCPSTIICDAEGGEKELFATTLPRCVNTIIMEIHRSVLRPRGIAELFDGLIGQGFSYAPKGSRGAVVCFERIKEI